MCGPPSLLCPRRWPPGQAVGLLETQCPLDMWLSPQPQRPSPTAARSRGRSEAQVVQRRQRPRSGRGLFLLPVLSSPTFQASVFLPPPPCHPLGPHPGPIWPLAQAPLEGCKPPLLPLFLAGTLRSREALSSSPAGPQSLSPLLLRPVLSPPGQRPAWGRPHALLGQ